MRVIVICVIFSFLVISEAVPADYIFQTWSRAVPEMQQCKMENRLGLTDQDSIITKDENSETEEIAEDEELNRLFNNFWAVDHLPKTSPYVSIQKLPDVYMDENDQPGPISDVMPVEISEITEEARDIGTPEFGERPLYDQSVQMVDNVGGIHQYPDHMAYPQYHIDQYENYEDVNTNSDNNTQYPSEVEIEIKPDIPKQVESKKDEAVNGSPKNTEETTPNQNETDTTTCTTTSKTMVTTKKTNNTTDHASHKKQSENTTIQEHSTKIKNEKIVASEQTTVCTDKSSTSSEEVTTSSSHSDNVMKISNGTHKVDKKKIEKK